MSVIEYFDYALFILAASVGCHIWFSNNSLLQEPKAHGFDSITLKSSIWDTKSINELMSEKQNTGKNLSDSKNELLGLKKDLDDLKKAQIVDRSTNGDMSRNGHLRVMRDAYPEYFDDESGNTPREGIKQLGNYLVSEFHVVKKKRDEQKKIYAEINQVLEAKRALEENTNMIIPFIPFTTYSPIIFSIFLTMISFCFYFKFIDINFDMYQINFFVPEVVIPAVLSSAFHLLWESYRFYSNIKKYCKLGKMAYIFCEKKIMEIYKNTLIVFKHVLSKLYDKLLLTFTYLGKLFNENSTVKFFEESLGELANSLGSALSSIGTLLQHLFNKSEGDNSDVDMPDPNEDEPGPGGGGPGPNGDDSDPEDNDSKKKIDKGKGKAIEEEVPEEYYNQTKLDKGKGKAKAATPEELLEEPSEELPEELPEESKEASTDYDEENFQKDLERAKFNSLNDSTYGESSRDGATLVEREQEQDRLDSLREARGESSTQGASIGPDESAETQGASLGPSKSTETQKEVSYEDFLIASEKRMAAIRDFNSITETLNSEDQLDAVQRQTLLESSIALKNYVQQADEHIAYLIDSLSIPSDDRGYESSSNEESYEYSSSSEDESRPNKRSKK